MRSRSIWRVEWIAPTLATAGGEGWGVHHFMFGSNSFGCCNMYDDALALRCMVRGFKLSQICNAVHAKETCSCRFPCKQYPLNLVVYLFVVRMYTISSFLRSGGLAVPTECCCTSFSSWSRTSTLITQALHCRTSMKSTGTCWATWFFWFRSSVSLVNVTTFMGMTSHAVMMTGYGVTDAYYFSCRKFVFFYSLSVVLFGIFFVFAFHVINSCVLHLSHWLLNTHVRIFKAQGNRIIHEIFFPEMRGWLGLTIAATLLWAWTFTLNKSLEKGWTKFQKSLEFLESEELKVEQYANLDGVYLTYGRKFCEKGVVFC